MVELVRKAVADHCYRARVDLLSVRTALPCPGFSQSNWSYKILDKKKGQNRVFEKMVIFSKIRFGSS
jgi:hypothetical protein